jgi:transcription elongation GreA/GreB family factor
MKKQTIEAFIAYFEKELGALVQSAKAAHQAAIHEESKAEDRHDTFAIEASYLAAGQAERVHSLRRTLQELTRFLESAAPAPTRAEPGALLVLESEGKKTYSLLVESGGGAQVKVDGKTVTLISLSSPLGEQLEGLKPTDQFTLETKTGSKAHEILEIH